jgi:DNA-binding GntR family transcriptional regulator
MVSLTQLPPLISRPESLSTLVLDQIRAAIVDRELAPGVRISEAALAAQLHVSKTPVREALLRLRLIGLVTAVGSGLEVVRPSRESIRDAYEVRAGLEGASAFHAASRASEVQLKSIAESAARSLERKIAGDVPGFREFDNRFHREVASCTRNERLAAFIDDALDLASALRLRDVPVTGASIACAQEHVAIAEAIAKGRAEDAST